MSDFKIAALIETNAGQVAREVTGTADAIERVGTSSAAASRGVDQLAAANRQLADAQRAVQVADAAVAKMQDRTDATRPRVIAQIGVYNKAIDEQRVAHMRLATAIKSAQDAQDKAAVSQARHASTAGTGGGLSRRDVATGVGLGVAGERAIEFGLDKAREFITGSTEQASKLTETLGTNRDVFGSYAADVDRFGKTAAASLGLSRQAAVETTDAFGQAFHAVGVGDDKALQLSTGLTRLGVDLAAFKHEADPGNAMHALQQAIVGQYDALHNYDLVLTTATVQEEAFKLGLIRTRNEALTPQAKALAVTALVTEQAHTQTGAFARSSDDLAGKQKILSARIKDAQADLGKGLMPAMAGAADIANGTLVPALTGIGKAIGFIGEHDLSRHIAEVVIAMYGLNAVVNLTAAAYGRLTGAATTAAVAEEGAAVAGGAGGLLPVAGRFGRAGSVLGLVATPAGAVATAGVVSAFAELDKYNREKQHALSADQAVDAAGTAAEARKTEADLRAKARKLQEQHEHTGFFGLVKEFLPFVASSDPLDLSYADTEAADRARRKALDLEDDARRQRILARSPLGAARARVDSAQYDVRHARAYLDSRSYVKDAGSIPLGGLLDALPEKPDQSILQNARDAEKSAKAAVAIAEARVKQARGSGGVTASAGQIDSLRASVLTAEDAVRRRGGNSEAEALRLQAAQERLNTALQGGKTNTLGLMTAEKGLADAHRTAAKATADRAKAEKEASGDKSLSLKDVLARATHTAATAKAEDTNVKTLVKKGLTEPVIAELEGLEQTAPGTMAKVAAGLTPAYVKQLNADAKIRTQAALDMARLGGVANLQELQRVAAAAGNSLAAAVQRGWAEGWTENTPRSGRDEPHIATPAARAGIQLHPRPAPSTPRSGRDEPHVAAPVALHLTPVRSEIVRGMVAPDIARAQRVLVATGVLS